MFEKLNHFLTNVETTFNFADSLPVIGIASSALRVEVFQIQFIAGACLALTAAAALLSGNNRLPWRKVVHQGFDLMIQGALNIIRGLGTFLLASVGLNVLLLPWQLFRIERFAPIVPYGSALKANVYA